MDPQDLSAIVLEYLNAHRRAGAPQVTMDTELIASGALDSLQILDLIEFAEKRFELSLVEDDLSPLHFESVERIVSLILKKQSGRRG